MSEKQLNHLQRVESHMKLASPPRKFANKYQNKKKTGHCLFAQHNEHHHHCWVMKASAVDGAVKKYSYLEQLAI